MSLVAGDPASCSHLGGTLRQLATRLRTTGRTAHEAVDRGTSDDDLLALALINYGHFTTMRVDAGRIRGLSDHCARLVRDCRRLFGAELDPDRLRGYLRQTLHDAATGAGSFLVRVTVYDPGADLIRPDGEPAVLITLRPAGPVPASR